MLVLQNSLKTKLMDELKKYIQETFKIDAVKFLEILKTNPNARQNINGILGEMLFKEYAEEKGYHVLRIKEKPEGGDDAKSSEARGDFYIKKKDLQKDEWIVVECKNFKSNSEKRVGLTNRDTCINLLIKHSIKRKEFVESIYKSGEKEYQRVKANWEKGNPGQVFPPFNWSKLSPGPGIPDLTGLWNDEKEVAEWIHSFPDDDFSEASFSNLKAPIRLLQTHMPSTREDPITKIESTGPLVGEFSILCVDLFFKTGKHEFVFANSYQLNHQRSSPNHLQQNYTVDILTSKDGFSKHDLLEPWFDDIDKCIADSKPIPRKLDESQLDGR